MTNKSRAEIYAAEDECSKPSQKGLPRLQENALGAAVREREQLLPPVRSTGAEQVNWRSSNYLKAARGQECQVRIDGVCNGNHETVVAAHSNQHIHGKGGALKAHDIFVAWACSECHRELDQGQLSYDEKAHYWRRGFERTLLEACEQGILKVK